MHFSTTKLKCRIPGRKEEKLADCAACQAPFGCDPHGDCWCKKQPPVHPVPMQAGATCLCPSCLEKHAGPVTPRPCPEQD
ncbi:hypothetical protein AA15237_1725 [Komagataeibacter xylinus NBRC 15237]|nr:hypothetical protein AA15237_1725 [Komagataeibacter xylinus NBRC 15237]